MRRHIHWLAPVALLAMTASARAETWSYTGDFAVILPQVGTGPGNAWWYEHGDGADADGDYPLFTTGNASSYTFGPNPFHTMSAGSLHPGTFNFNNPASNPEADCIIEFRAPAAGVYTVTGFISDGDGSDSDGPLDGRGIKITLATNTTPGVAGHQHHARGRRQRRAGQRLPGGAAQRERRAGRRIQH
jgi:hypothetical protein